MAKREMAYDSFAIDAQKASIDPRTGDLHLPLKVAKVGIMTYPESGGQRRYFPPETLKNAVDSLAYASITRLHPEEKEVNADNVGRVRKGFIKEDSSFDGTYIKSNAVVTDEGLINDITRRILTEASAGYPYEHDGKPGKNEHGKFDTTITWIGYNHVAAVPVGRAGSDVKFELDHKGKKMANTKERELPEFKIGNDQLLTRVSIVYDPETSQTAVDAMSGREETLMSEINRLTTANITLQASNDASKESLKQIQTAQDSMIKAEDLSAMVSDLVESREVALKVGLDCKTDTDSHEIKTKIIKKMLPDAHKSLQERDQLKDKTAVDAAYIAFRENISFHKEMHNTQQALDGKQGTNVLVKPVHVRGVRSLEELRR